MNTPDSKNTQNRPSFSCGLHYVRAFTGWPMLNNAGNSFENLTWCSELDCIFSLPQLIYFWLISNKNYNPLIRYQWFGKDCLLIFNPFYKCARIKDRFSCKCQQKEGSSGWTVHYLMIGKLSKCRDFTVLWLIQKIDYWLELTSSITFIWLLQLVASQRTVPRSFRGEYAASFSVT